MRLTDSATAVVTMDAAARYSVRALLSEPVNALSTQMHFGHNGNFPFR